MHRVADEIGIESCEGISMPMEFERLANEYMRKNPFETSDIYLKMKRLICERLQEVKLPKNAIHHRLRQLPLNTIMTTNYDYLLEYVFKNDYKCAYTTQKYVFDRTSKLGNMCFYHPHGIASLPKSLCLGYEHYMGIVENLRQRINTKKNGNKSDMLIKRVLFGEDEPTREWGELFYTDNIAFVGLGLDSCEADIWWLLTHRAYLYHTNYEKIRSRLTNNIVYYDIIDVGEGESIWDGRIRKKIKEAKARKHLLLESEHVVVKTYVVRNNEEYAEQYQKILDDIKHNGICGKSERM